MLGAATELGLTGEVAGPDALPESLGLYVSGSSNYRVDPGRFPGMLLTEDDHNRQTRFREVHIGIVAGLLETLPQLGGIRWALSGLYFQARAGCGVASGYQ